MSVALQWAIRCSASMIFLQVGTRNANAIALYRGLGFALHHRYDYWSPAG
jgi:ribosomal protein S18 acetylase RimI-like enzyme